MRINGGFFVFRRTLFDYIHKGEACRSRSTGIADRELLAYEYDGFWAPMDTLKDRERLEGLVRSGDGAWQVWATEGAAAESRAGLC